MLVDIEPDSPVPTYEQLRAQIATMIAAGVLEPGRQLPSIRQLAGDLGVAPGTVARAYKELEQAGLVGGRGRGGTVVRKPATTIDAQHELAAAARAFAVRARHLGADVEEAGQVVRAAMLATGPAAPAGHT